MSGAINLKKVDEKSTFKRTKVIPKRRGNSSGNELLSPSTISLASPPFSSPFESREQPQINKGPTLYVRGFDLVADSLQKAFVKHGAITRLFVEERQKSAFITFSTTEEAEAALKNMDGYMLNGITLHVSFARRQNQNSRSPRECTGNRGGSRGRGSFSCANPRGRGGDRTPWEQRRFDSSNGTDRSQRGGGSFQSFDGDERRPRQQFSSRSPSADRRSSRSPSQDRRSSRSPSGDEKVLQQKCHSRSPSGNDKASLGQHNFHFFTKECGHSRGRLRGNDKRLWQKRPSSSPCGDRRSSRSPSQDRPSSRSPSQDRRSSRSTNNEEKMSPQQRHPRSSSKDERTSRGQPQFRFGRGGSRLAQGYGGVRNHDRRSWQKPHPRSPSVDRRSSRSLSQDRRSSRSPSGDEKTPQQQCTSHPPHGDDMFSKGQHSLRFIRAGGRPSRPRGSFRGNNRRSWQKQTSRSPSADRRSSRSPSQDRRSSCSPNRDEKTAQKQRLVQSPSGNDRSSRRRSCPFGRGGERSRGHGGFRGSERRLWQKRLPHFPNANRRSSHSPNQDRCSSRSPSEDRRSSRSLSGDEGTSQHRLPRSHSIEGRNDSRSSKGSGSTPRGQHSSSSFKESEGARLSPPPSVTPAALAAWNSAVMASCKSVREDAGSDALKGRPQFDSRALINYEDGDLFS
uniref:Negative elongation factor E n=1 Tax=Ascaris lumbricoides TaxID=6252 RepID=A0A0M3IC24_ASCLU